MPRIGELCYDRRCVVGGAIVHDNGFPIGIGLRQDTLESVRQVPAVVVSCNDNANCWHDESR